MMPSCLFVPDFAQKSVPKIGKHALILVQSVNSNGLNTLSPEGGSGGVFFNKIPIIDLDNI